MKKQNKINAVVFSAVTAAALSGLFAGSAVAAPMLSGINQTGHSVAAAAGVSAFSTVFEQQGGKHDCKGHNECKGNGGCKSGDNGCKGTNSCKGKGGCATNK